MLNTLSLIIGAIALILAIPALIPIISLLNWIVFPMALVGLALGLVSDRNEGRNLNILVALVSGLRLFFTWGIF